MNEKIDLTEILKYGPVGWELYSSVLGEVSFKEITDDEDYPITVDCENWGSESFTAEGKLYIKDNGECILFPSKDQRDWSKFSAYWYNPEKKEKDKFEPNKKEKFDPKTLKPFDRVLVSVDGEWQCDLFSHMLSGGIFNKCCIGVGDMNIVIPYNDDTKHLLGSKNEAPEYYRYWED